MPPRDPGSLSQQAYSEIVGYIGSINGYEAAPAVTAAKRLEVTVPISGEDAAGGTPSETPLNLDAKYKAAVAEREALLGAMKPVTEALLREPPSQDWLNWRRTDDGFGFGPSQSINRQNVSKLGLAWSLALPIGTNEIIPLVHDGVMFVNSNGTVFAINASTGDVLWKFIRLAQVLLLGPPVTQPRNMAIFGSILYVPTVDNHMLALEARTGKLLWDHAIEQSNGVLRLTAGPIIVHGKLIQGVSGCAGVGRPGGCYIVALDARTGDEVWRFNTIARPGAPQGDTWNGAALAERFGGSVWSSGTYDSEYNLVYFGTGQTYHIAPLMAHKPISANKDALYTDTTLALDPDTGKLVWFYQHMARDVWDLDWAYERTIATLPSSAGPRKMVVTLGKLGILDALDAKTGAYIFSYDVGLQDLVTSIDPRTGRKRTDSSKEPNPLKSVSICPYTAGARTWPATSYDPLNSMLYVPLSDSCMEYSWNPSEGWDIHYTLKPRPKSDGNYGEVMAIDLNTRQQKWAIRRRAPQSSSVLATAGGLLFEGSRDRWFRASDSASGRVLWQARLDNVPSASPITFMVGNEQYVSITTGGGGPNDVTVQPLTPEIEATSGATTLWTFKLSNVNQPALLREAGR
jgi:alcohol dehydrogenase (cytochrome c)